MVVVEMDAAEREGGRTTALLNDGREIERVHQC